MDEATGGLRMAGGGRKGLDPYGEPELGATGLYYITPGDDTSLSGKRVFTRLVTLPMYILRELLKGVLLSTAVFSVILMAVFAGQVLRDGVGPYTMALVLPNFLPLICPFVLPLAIITGILICYSRLSKDNEILAAYAGGVNPFWLMLPALITSVLAIFVTLTLNEVAMHPAIVNIEQLVRDDQHNILRRMISRPGNITVPTGSEFIAMSKVDPSLDPLGRASLDITRFASTDPAGNGEDFPWDPRYPFPSKRVVARDHEVRDFSEDAGEQMTMKMHVTKPIFEDLHISKISRSFIADSEAGEERVVLGGRARVTIHANRSSFWPILMLSNSRREAEDTLASLNSLDTKKLSEVERVDVHNRKAPLRRVIQNRTSEINMRLALCFSCLAFAVLGIPLGMRTRGTLIASFVWGIGTAGVYFLALKAAESQVSRGLLPYWVIWIPDALVVLVGVCLWFLNTRRS